MARTGSSGPIAFPRHDVIASPDVPVRAERVEVLRDRWRGPAAARGPGGPRCRPALSERIMAPPRSTPSFAERHGMFDTASGAGGESRMNGSAYSDVQPDHLQGGPAVPGAAVDGAEPAVAVDDRPDAAGSLPPGPAGPRGRVDAPARHAVLHLAGDIRFLADRPMARLQAVRPQDRAGRAEWTQRSARMNRIITFAVEAADTNLTLARTCNPPTSRRSGSPAGPERDRESDRRRPDLARDGIRTDRGDLHLPEAAGGAGVPVDRPDAERGATRS